MILGSLRFIQPECRWKTKLGYQTYLIIKVCGNLCAIIADADGRQNWVIRHTYHNAKLCSIVKDSVLFFSVNIYFPIIFLVTNPQPRRRWGWCQCGNFDNKNIFFPSSGTYEHLSFPQLATSLPLHSIYHLLSSFMWADCSYCNI